jgi:hypothetical protein
MPRWLGIAYIFLAFPACGVVAASLMAGRMTSPETLIALGVLGAIGLLHLLVRRQRSKGVRFDGPIQTGADGGTACDDAGDCGGGGEDGGGDGGGD